MRTTTRWGSLCVTVFIFFTTVTQAANESPERGDPPGPRVKSQVVIGQYAPDFNVPRLRLSTSDAGQPIGMVDVDHPFHLANLRGKRPVCLIMSSYTWPPFTKRAAELERLYVSYKDKVDFVIVYIREAHADRLEKDQDVAVKNQPKSLEERTILATQCVAKYKFTIPMVLDNLEGSVARAYQAMPVRVTLTDTAGKVVYYGGKGPRNFKIPEIEAALKKLVAREDEKIGR